MSTRKENQERMQAAIDLNKKERQFNLDRMKERGEITQQQYDEKINK